MFVNMIMAVLQEFFRNTLTIRWISELGRLTFMDKGLVPACLRRAAAPAGEIIWGGAQHSAPCR